ncbi:DoxX family protein [Flavobacterium aquicola]|uniref:Putative oxidoreductase n=1 Tax=Flavobacterium aquicola TaxID=1682742 RepID=A0A3E0EQI2_9FLAO|nr:DoxX family membrane protein [Flavobacterium aquicola]REG99416.1 putative oxidoreductase [Flavobacterium aquicola]
MKNFPFPSLSQSLLLFRILLPLFFVAHAVTRIANGTIDRFAGFLATKGFFATTVMVWGITAYEIIGGIALAFGYYKKYLSLGFILMLIMGNIIIHYENGWWVGEHGEGGMEYSCALILGLIVIASTEKESIK